MISFKQFIIETITVTCKTPYTLTVTFSGSSTRYKYHFASPQAVEDAYKRRRNIKQFKEWVKNLEFDKIEVKDEK